MCRKIASGCLTYTSYSVSIDLMSETMEKPAEVRLAEAKKAVDRLEIPFKLLMGTGLMALATAFLANNLLSPEELAKSGEQLLGLTAMGWMLLYSGMVGISAMIPFMPSWKKYQQVLNEPGMMRIIRNKRR